MLNSIEKIITATLLIVLVSFAQDELTLLATIQGENEGDRFAHVDAIGDINGDGYNDFIVGGKGDYVKLYFGSENFDTTNYIRFNKGTWKRVFASGCGVGDLNGDGYNDFVINTIFNVWDWRVYVYFGGEEIDTTNYLVIRNTEYWYSGFGGSSINGDLNGDGYDDLVISAPNDDIDARGRVYIYFGGEEMNTECDVYLEGKEPGDNFGNSVSIVGDVNGDGYDDLLVGAPQTGNPIPTGKAYLFWGGENIGFENCVEFLGADTGSAYGFIVACLGDINNDGFSDFGIKGSNYVDIYSGATQEKLLTITSNENYWYPLNISNGYDLNDDGYSDYIISFAHQENQYAGGIAIYLGGDEIDTTASIILDGTTKNGYFGEWISIGGDVNYDGTPEIFIGEGGELTQSGTLGPGSVYIYSYNKLSGVENPSKKILPTVFDVKHNYPNPFNPLTKIRYTVYEACELDLIIYDITGKEINRLFTGYQMSGSYEITWEGVDYNYTQVSSGVYFLRVSAVHSTTNSQLQQKIVKMLLMR